MLLGLACLLTLKIHSSEYEPQFENDQICVARAKIQPNEEIGLHRDAYRSKTSAQIYAVRRALDTSAEQQS